MMPIKIVVKSISQSFTGSLCDFSQSVRRIIASAVRNNHIGIAENIKQTSPAINNR